MAKKIFKIGEYAVGGIISVETTKEHVIINALDWNSKKPVVAEMKISTSMRDARHNIECYLWDLTTSYYTSKIMEFVESKVNFSYPY